MTGERGLSSNAASTSEDAPKTEGKPSMKHEVKTNRPDGQGRVTIESYTRGKAIRIHCTECMGHESDPKDCTAKNCALFPYRKKTRMAYEKGAPKNAPTSALAAPEAR